MKENKTSARAWSNYWSNDFLTTFVDEQHKNYSGDIKIYWDEVFSGLGEGQHIVDLAAGNGALLALAKEHFDSSLSGLEMTAIDIADITGSSFYMENPKINLLPNTDIAQIPLSDSSIDICISQFGFEYSDTEVASREVARVLAPKGRFHAILHHASSTISLASGSAIEQIALCTRSRLGETAEKLLRRLQKLKKTHRDTQDDLKATELRNQFNQMATRLSEYGEKLPDAEHIKYFLNELGNLFSDKAKKLNLDQKLMLIKKLEGDSQNYRIRMLSMLEASMNQEQVENLKAKLIGVGLKVTSLKALSHESQDHAWILESVKP